MSLDTRDGSDSIVVGVDGGGTTTSVIAANITGRVLSRAEGGGANPQHNPEATARATVQETIRRAVEAAERDPGDVVALTAGLAGLNEPSDLAWARSFVAVPGLECTPTCVNDAVVAHTGALLGEPGIVAICGTGSIVFGRTGDGRNLRNDDFDHYARAAARHLGQRLLQALVGNESDVDLEFEFDLTIDADVDIDNADGGRVDHANRSLIDRALSEWGLETLEELAASVDETFASTTHSGNAMDSIAPTITDEAAAGSPFARAICDDALEEVVDGIRTVGSRFDECERVDPVPVAPMGSVLRNRYMRSGIHDALESDETYRVVDPAVNATAGAVLESLRRLNGQDGVDLEAAIDRLSEDPVCSVS